MNDVLEISYRLNRSKMLLMAGAFALSAIGLVYFAVTNDRGLILFHLITLSQIQATLFYWAMSGVSGWVTVMAVIALTTGVTDRDHQIRLTPDEFTAPQGFFRRRPVTVPLYAIYKTRVHSANGTRYLNLKTVHGRINISRRDIGPAAFEELCAALDSRMRSRPVTA